MAFDEVIGFTRSAAAKIKRVVQQYGRTPTYRPRYRGRYPVINPDPIIVARITGGNNPYSAVQVLPTASGAWATKSDGITWTAAGPHPLYERNDTTGIAAGTYVLVWKAYIADDLTGREWVFDFPDSPAVTYVNESGIVANILTDNARMCIQTRGTPVSVTGTGFGPDRWWVEAENNGVDYADQADPSPTACCGARFTKTTSTGKFLVAQWLKGCPYKFYNSRAVHVQAAIKASTSLNLRFGFLLWNGTRDTITTPHFSAWGASGALPTPVANMTASIATIAVTTTEANFSASNSSLSFANLAWVVWTDDQVAAGTWIEFTDAFLGAGTEYLTPYPVAPKIDIDACAYHGTLGGVFN